MEVERVGMVGGDSVLAVVASGNELFLKSEGTVSSEAVCLVALATAKDPCFRIDMAMTVGMLPS